MSKSVHYPAGWVSKAEACRIIEKSDSTLERLVTEQLVESKNVARAGRKPERIYSEQSLLEMKKKLNRRHEPDATNNGAVARPRIDHAGMLQSFLQSFSEGQQRTQQLQLEAAAHERRRSEMQSKLWLNLEEAVAYSGLGVGAILSAAAEQKLILRRMGPHGSIVIKRSSLEAFEG